MLEQSFLSQVVRGVVRQGRKVDDAKIEAVAGWPHTTPIPLKLRIALQVAYDNENGATGKWTDETQDERFVRWFKVRAAFIARDFGLARET